GPTAAECRHHARNDGRVAEEQEQLGPTHPTAPAGGGDHGRDHGAAATPASQREPAGAPRRDSLCARDATPWGPRLRRAISSATILIAISTTVCEPISSPTGAATRRKSASGIPSSRSPSKMSRILRRLPISPTYAAGVGARR